MPSKKKKYNSRFPPARIKKIMQSDEEVGKVAQVVPIIISKALEIFVASLLKSSSDITRSRNARTLTPNHIKQSILSSNQFNFLRDLAQTIPDVNPGAEGEDEDASSTGAASTGGVSTGGQQQIAAHSFHRKVSENRTTIAATTSSGHQLSAAGQSAAISFRGRGRPRKKLIQESQSSIRSMTSTEEPEDDEETEEEDEDEEDPEDEEDINSDNNNRNNNNNNSNQQNNNNNNNFSANNYYSTTQPSNPSQFVSTIQSMASSSAAIIKSNHIVEDDDYDN